MGMEADVDRGGEDMLDSQALSAVLLNPLDGEEIDDLVQIRWRVNGYEKSNSEIGDVQILIHINGNIVGASANMDGSWDFSYSDHAAGGLTGRSGRRAVSIMIILCSLDDKDSIVKVLSSDQVDIFSGAVSTQLPSGDAERACKEAENWDWSDTTGGSPASSNEPAALAAPGTGGGDETRERLVIFSFHCNRPDFLLLQARALEKFMLDDFMLVVIDDAKDPAVQAQFREFAANLGADYRETPDWGREKGRFAGDVSVTHGKTLTWAMQEIAIKEHPSSLVFFIEGDMFPVAPFSVNTFMRGFDMAGLPQERKDIDICFVLRYLWGGLVFFNLPQLPNKHLLRFETDMIHGMRGDTGAALHRFLDASPDVRVRPVRSYTDHIRRDRNLDSIPAVARSDYRDWFKLEIYERAFLHYGSASNWKLGRHKVNSPMEFMPEKTRFVKELVDSSVDGSISIS